MSGILTAAAFLQLAAACAPGLAPETLAAIARTESALDSFAIGVNGPGGGAVRVETKQDAVARAKALISAGWSVDLGVMQINSKNLAWLGLSIEEAFDACRSIAAGAKVLTAYSGYNTGSPTRGFTNGYVQRVLSAGGVTSETTEVTAPVPAAAPVPPPCAPEWDSWALARCQKRSPRPPPPSSPAVPPGEAPPPRPSPLPEYP